MAMDTQADVTISGTKRKVGETRWAFTGIEADASTQIIIKAAPGAGLALYLTHVIMTSNDADANPFLQDEDDNLLFGPFVSSVEGVVINHKFEFPLRLVTNKALEIKATVGVVTVYVEGFTAG